MKKINIKGPIVSNDTGWVYHYIGWDACCPKDVENALKEAAGDEVILEINSNGGVATSGFEIYKMIKDYVGKVTAHVINACSAATFPMCASDEVLVSDAAIIMIHNTQSGTSGDYRDMQMAEDMLIEFNQSVINVYEIKTGMHREEIQNLMDHDTFMSPKKAIELGFADGYIYSDLSNDPVKEDAVSNNMAVAFNAVLPIMSENKAHEIMQMIQSSSYHPRDQSISDPDKTKQNLITSDNSDRKTIKSNKKTEGEKETMTLEEMYQEHPELKGEVDTLLESAKNEGAKNERSRIQALDAISNNVTGDALESAKYGADDKRMTAHELAYQEMLQDKGKANAYMSNALDDSEDSGVNKVGAIAVDLDELKDESDQMAAYTNKRRGGKL